LPRVKGNGVKFSTNKKKRPKTIKGQNVKK